MMDENRGIQKTLGIWLVSYIICNLFIFIYPSLLPPMLIDSDSDVNFSIFLLVSIGLCFISFIVYLLCTIKINMTTKEKVFLKRFSLYPLLISIFKSLEMVSSYILLGSISEFFNLIPIELIITMIAIYQLYRYFKDKRFRNLCLLLLFLSIAFVLMRVYVYLNETQMSSTVLYLMTICDDIASLYDYSLCTIVSLGLSILFMKKITTFDK